MGFKLLLLLLVSIFKVRLGYKVKLLLLVLLLSCLLFLILNIAIAIVVRYSKFLDSNPGDEEVLAEPREVASRQVFIATILRFSGLGVWSFWFRGLVYGLGFGHENRSLDKILGSSVGI